MINKIKDYVAIFFSHLNYQININKNIVNIDLSNNCNHLGDVLIFGPLIAGLIKSGYIVRVSDAYGFYRRLLNLEGITSEDGFYIGRSYLDIDRRRIGKKGLINFYSFPARPIAQALHDRFIFSASYDQSLNLIKDNLKKLSAIFNLEFSSLAVDGFDKFIVVSPSMNSRSFGFYPSKRSMESGFIKNILQYKEKNIRIILIGQSNKSPSSFEIQLAGLVDLDLRGKTHWLDLPGLFSRPECCAVVTFDTFTYHLAVLLDKKIDLFSKSWLSKSEYKWIANRFTPAF